MTFSNFIVNRNTSKIVLGVDGLLKEVVKNEPAIEFNIDGSCRGLLVEPAATNFFIKSEDFSYPGTGFISDNVSVSVDLDVAPDGSRTADRVIENNASSRHRLQRNLPFPFTSGSIYTLSVYAKSSNRNTYLNASFAINAAAGFDLSAGTVNLVSGSARIEDVGNGWYRCSVTGTATASGSITFYIQNQIGTTEVSYTGDNSSYVTYWGAQMEEGPIATSYIPTTDELGGVTREKDDISLTSASSLIGQKNTGGTLYVEVDWRNLSGEFQNLLTVSDGSSSNRLFIYKDLPSTLSMATVVNSALLTDQGQDSSAYSGIQKIAFAYNSNDFELYRNGFSISKDPSGSLATLATLTTIDLGQNQGAGSQANMHIRTAAIYNKRLSNSELAELTTI